MTERSYFHNGVGAGDATEAPYDLLTYQMIRSLLSASGGAFVFGPDAYGSATPLLTSPNAGMVVTVAAGTAFVYGIYCAVAAENFTMPANTSGMPRIDRLVLRVRWGTTPSAALGILTGVPNSVPVIPEPTQLPGDLYEMPIARIFIPSGLAAVVAGNIIDEREFIGRTTEYYSPENMLPNSEFMAAAGTSGSNGAAARGFAPAFWQLHSTTTLCEAQDKFPQMERGSTAKVTCPSAPGGIRTILPHLALAANMPTTIRLLIEVTKGEVWIDTAGGAANGVRVPVSNGPVEVILRRTFTAGDPTLELYITNNLTTETIFRLGAVTVAHGLVGVNYLPVKETLIFNMSILHPWSTGFSTGGSYNIDMADFPLALGCSTALMKLEVSDSGSNGTINLFTSLQDPVNGADWLRCEVGNMPNNKRSIRQGFVGMPFDSITRVQQVTVNGVASGVETMLQYMYLLGCVT